MKTKVKKIKYCIALDPLLFSHDVEACDKETALKIFKDKIAKQWGQEFREALLSVTIKQVFELLDCNRV